MYRPLPLLVLIGFFAAACGDEPVDNSSQNDPNTNAFNVDNPPQWQDASDLPNAMNRAGHDLLPWPADQYMNFGDDGPTLRVDASLLPPAMTPSLISGSGVSRVTPIVTRLPGGVDPRTLPDPDDWGATLDEDSPVRVIVLQDDAEPTAWPVLAELDATESDPTAASLLIRPHRPFPAGSRVAVGLRTDLRTFGCYAQDHPDQFDDADDHHCDDHQPADALPELLGGYPEDRALQGWLGEPADALSDALPYLGPQAADLVQAWTFTVRSKEEVIDPLVAMQQIAAEADPSSFEVETVEYQDNRALVYGTVDVPWFLDDDDELVLDDQGAPVVQQTRPVPFLVTIPDTVTEPRPVVLFGHGFFSSIEESTWGNLFNGLQRWEMAAITTRFYGFSEPDLPRAAEALGGETLEGMTAIIDMQRQSQANFTVVHNMVRDHLAEELTLDFGDGEFSPLNPDEIPYMGISNGGTQGLVMMSTSPVLERGALVVPGGGWSHMLQRAAQWTSLGIFFSNRFNDNDDLQLAMAMLQQVFDPVDSLNYVEHLVQDRLPGLPEAPPILVVEAVNDSQVANLVTRWVVGTAGVPTIVPSVAEVWDNPTVDASAPDGAPGGVGFESFDLGVPDNPPGNISPEENGVHDDVRRLDAYREQMGIFLEDGRVLRTCDGPCDPE